MANEQSITPIPAQQPRTIPLAQIHELPGVFNPKPVESKMGSLILSIQNSGVMEPIILRRRDDGEYQLLSGYRRVAASERAGKKDIPAYVYEMTMQEAIAYRKAVKNDPKAPIPGKLAAAEAEGKDKEKPVDPAKITPADKDSKDPPGQPDAADKGKDGEKPADPEKTESPKKDDKEKADAAPAAPGDKDKAQTAAGEKDKPGQPDAADKGKDGDKPADPEKAAPPKKDDKEKRDAAPAAPGDKDKTQTVAEEKDKPVQPAAADKGKDGEKLAESAGKEEHNPPAAELTAKADADEPVKLHPSNDGIKPPIKAPTEKKADAPALKTAVKGSASTAIKKLVEDHLEPPTEKSRKTIPIPGDSESVFVTLHPAYLEKSPLNTFSVDTESENFKELCKSIELVGIKDPVLARFNDKGKLEILSGQRRHIAATMLNCAVPTIIQKIDDADAKILVADGNLHRDKISSYDLSRALRMKMEGMKQKAGRRKKGFAASELQSDAKLAQEMGMSVSKLNRMIHLSEAIKDVCDMVDEGRLTISVASEIAYLKTGTQESVVHLMDLGYKVTNERIQRIKRVEISGKKPDEMMLRNILDDKDIAPKQQPQPTAQQPTAASQPAAPQPAPAAQTAPAVQAPAPETIPASPNVAAQTPSSAGTPVNAVEQKPKVPDVSGTTAMPSKPEDDDITKGPQERPEETKILLKGDRLRKYFPDVSMTPREIEESIYSALEERRQRQLHQQQKPALLKR